MAKNKVVYGSQVIIDLTDATAVASDVVTGKYFYGNDGVRTQGTVVNGDSLGYGITDGTIPKAGIAKAGSAVLGG